MEVEATQQKEGEKIKIWEYEEMASQVKGKSSQGENRVLTLGENKEEHCWTGSILPLEWGGNKIQNKADAEK